VNEDRASRYHRLKRRAAVASVAATLALLAGLTLGNGSIALRDLAVRLASGVPAPAWLAPWLIVAAYIVLLAAVSEAVALPFGYVHGFVLERRYGLSTQRPVAWLRDHLKACGVALVLALLAGSWISHALRAWPGTWWIAGAAGFAAATIVLAQFAPVVLLPLFYRLRPLESEALRARLLGLARRARTRVLGVYEWRLGDRTTKANAALVGLNGTRRILLSDTLLAHYSEDEIEVVLAHELAHHVHGDMWKTMALESVLTFGGFFLADRVLRWAVPRVGLTGLDDVAGLPVLLLTAGLLSLAFVPAANAMSRRHERRADRYALDATRNVEAFVSAVRRLGAQNLAEERPSRLVEVLFYTHPPAQERIAAAREWEQRRPVTPPAVTPIRTDT
jgi:STE24 endopeptidase